MKYSSIRVLAAEANQDAIGQKLNATYGRHCFRMWSFSGYYVTLYIGAEINNKLAGAGGTNGTSILSFALA